MKAGLITVDFWNTMVSAKTNAPQRHQARVESIMQHGKPARNSLTEEQIENALAAVSAHFDRVWLSTARTLAAAELVDALEQELRLIFPNRKAVTHELQRSIMAGIPDWAPGAVEAVKMLSETATIAIISDTKFSNGAVLRELFDRAGLLDHIHTFVFSDEMGWSKPDRRSFLFALEKTGVSEKEALHIGDMQATDIHGAQNAGMKAVLFCGINSSDRESNTADAILDDWGQVQSVLSTLS